MEAALASTPKQVALNKMPVVKRFSQLMKRKTSLVHLSQASRSALAADVDINQMQMDWERRTEHDTVCSQLVWTMPELGGASQTEIRKQMNVFQKLLESQASVEEHVKWVEEVRTFFVEKHPKDSKEYLKAERSFLAGWSYICSLIIRDQTLRSATSFGSFHLLNMLYEEYLLFVAEVHRYQREEMDLWRRVMGDKIEPPEDFLQMDIDLDIDDCDDLQDFFPSPTKLMSSHDGDVFNMDITPGKPGLKEEARMNTKEPHPATRNILQAPMSAAYKDIMTASPGPAVKQSDIIPLAFAASSTSGHLTVPIKGGNRPDSSSKEFAYLSPDKSASSSAACGATSTAFITRQAKLSCTTPEVKCRKQSTPTRASNFVASKLVRATLLTVVPPSAPGSEGSQAGSSKTEDGGPAPPVITLNIPSVPGLDLHQGQFLTAADGKKYVINDVQAVLQPSDAK